MDEVLSTVTAILISVVLLFIMPVHRMIEQNQQAMDTYVYTEMVDLIDRIRNTGCLSQEMYIVFTEALADTGMLYQVELQHFYETDEGIEEENFLEQIKSKLEADTVYYFQEGDTIRMKIKRRDNSIVGYYGGRIKDEDY